jgi:hypothetical protein
MREDKRNGRLTSEISFSFPFRSRIFFFPESVIPETTEIKTLVTGHAQ